MTPPAEQIAVPPMVGDPVRVDPMQLGATREGVLRNHLVMPDGTLRHTVADSITPEEWPRVEAWLRPRLRTGDG